MNDDIRKLLELQRENKKSIDLLHWKIETLAGRLALEFGFDKQEKKVSIHNDIESLLPEVQPLVRSAIQAAKNKGYIVRIYESLREYLVQVAYIMRGAKNAKGEPFSYEEICFAYEKAGLPKPDRETAMTQCTNTLRSNHLSGRAVDIGFSRVDGKPVTWSDWKTVAKCFTDLRFTWGKDWDRDGLTLEDGDTDESKWIQDAPHFEYPAKGV